jgi:hypothetical protein
MKFLKSLFSWFSKPKPEETPMADTPETPVVPVTVNVDVLKVFLKALGQDLNETQEQALALALKAV